MTSGDKNAGVVVVDDELLRSWPLPAPEDGDDKDMRGQVLIVGGTAVTPGAVILAGLGALRAGAGKLRIATAESAAAAVAVAVPEALVSGVPSDDPDAVAREVELLAEEADCVVIGPGMLDPDASGEVVEAVLPVVGDAVVVLDAAAVQRLPRLSSRTVLMPNVKEAARLLELDEAEVAADQRSCTERAASSLGVTVAIRGDETWLAAPDRPTHVDRSGCVGLATSGSGDVLSGVLGGLCARGADPLQAACWAVHLHGRAGERLAERIGPVGYLARELLDDVPLLLVSLAPPS